MADQSFLAWPFFEDRHRQLAADLDAWAGANLGAVLEPGPFRFSARPSRKPNGCHRPVLAKRFQLSL